MFENTSAARQRHQRFVERVVLSRVVWGLKGADGWAATTSTADGTRGREVLPFWSDRGSAALCVKESWANYEPAEIPLDIFLQRWLPRMAVERCLAGTNWSAQLAGHELEPDALRDELARQSGH
ncbi:MAG TPA: DUF2750 domain-containing protein [Candidatus Binatia bacterium]|nr:DUF2750 domain-containing protein [Candidatus Binatia bacterium]